MNMHLSVMVPRRFSKLKINVKHKEVSILIFTLIADYYCLIPHLTTRRRRRRPQIGNDGAAAIAALLLGNANSALVTLMMARNEFAKVDGGGRDSGVGVADLRSALETNVRIMNFRHVWSGGIRCQW